MDAGPLPHPTDSERDTLWFQPELLSLLEMVILFKCPGEQPEITLLYLGYLIRETYACPRESSLLSLNDKNLCEFMNMN